MLKGNVYRKSQGINIFCVYNQDSFYSFSSLKMKLYTDHGNFQTLKLFVAAEISKISLEVKSVNNNGK